MEINGKHYRSVWLADDGTTVEILDQTKLPYELEIIQLTSMQLQLQQFEICGFVVRH